MSTQTTNLHLVKPAANENVSRTVINSNYDIIDRQIHNKADSNHNHSYNDLTDKPTIPAAYNDTSVTNRLKTLEKTTATLSSQLSQQPSSYTIGNSNTLFVNQFLGVLQSYYKNRKKSDGSNLFTYNHNTALDSTYDNSNEIDCSAFVGLGLLGIEFKNSPYASLGSSQEGDSDTGNDGVENDDESDAANTDVSTTLTTGNYPWVIDFRNIYYKKVKSEYPVRTAAQMCQMMQEAGWAIKFTQDLSNVCRGDIVFYAKDATKTELLIRIIMYYNSNYTESELKEKTLNELVSIGANYVTGLTESSDMKIIAKGLGLPVLKQPNRYKNVSHVAAVSSIYVNNGSYGVDSKYPYKHTMYEVSSYGSVVLNTTLEKRYPDKIVAIMRPNFGEVAMESGCGSLIEVIGENNIDKVNVEGTYYVISTANGTFPDGVSKSGAQLIVKKSYNKWGRLYNVTQTLIAMSTSTTKATVNASKPKVYIRSNYCYANGTYVFRNDYWSDWTKLSTE